MQRRTRIKLGAASGALLALAGGGLALMRPGLRAGRLTPAGREVFTAVARGVLESSRCSPPSRRPSCWRQPVAARQDRGAPPLVQTRLQRLLLTNGHAQGHVGVSGGGHQLTSAAYAIEDRRPTSAARHAHFPAPGDTVGGHLRAAHRRGVGRNADALHRAQSRRRADRRPDRLQVRGTDHAPHHLRAHGDGLRRRAGGGHEAVPHTHALLALLRDGFNLLSVGGKVGLRSDGSPELDYYQSDFIMDGARRAQLSIYGLVAKLASGLARALSGREVRLT